MQFSARRDLREEAFNAWIKRGEMGKETDNRAITAEIIALRTEFAALLGFKTYAEYSLEETMAKTPSSVRGLLSAVWEPAVKRAASEREALQSRAREEGGNFAIAPWDWRYYAEKERKARYDVDEASTRPYLTARQRDRRGVRDGDAPVRPTLQGASRRAALSGGRAGVGGDRQARRPRRPVPRRLLRAAVEALRRVDVVVPLAVEGGGRGDPDHRQRDELCEGRGGPAEPSVAR